MARTAWRSGDFLDLRWHRAVLFEKPPLLFVLVGLSGGLLGFSDLAVRLPCALATVGWLWFSRGLALDLGLGRRTGRLAVLFGLASYTVVFHGRRVLADPLFVLFAVVALRAWVGLQRDPTARRPGLWLLCGLGLGGAILTKWVFVVLPLLAALGYHLTELRRPRARDVLAVGVVALAVAAPWHIVQSLRHGGAFWEVYAGYHVLERAQRALVAPSDAWTYARLFAETDGLLLGALLPALLVGLTLRGEALRRFAAPWFMAVLVLLPLLLSRTRMPHYLLSVMPFLLLGVAAGWEVLIARSRWAWAGVATLCIAGLVLAVGPHLVAPEYSPTSRRICADPAARQSLLVVNTYEVAATWYCDRPVPIHTDDPRFARLQGSIDMMARSHAVQLHEPAALLALLRDHPAAPILTRPGHGALLAQRLGAPPRRVETHRDADLLLPASTAPTR